MANLPTLVEVATAAGVSPATVSRALTGSVRVTTSTRRQVNEAVSRLGYVRRRAPHRLSAAIARPVVAAVICEPMPWLVSDPFYGRLLTAADEELAARGAALVVMPAATGRAAHLISHAIGGVLLVGAHDNHPAAMSIAASGVAVRSVGRPPVGVVVPYVDIDNAGGARQAAEHFLLAGRRVIGVIAGTPTLPAAQDRLDGFLKTLLAAGRADVPTAYGDFTHASGAHAMHWLLERAPRVDAVFAAADTMAVAAIQMLRRMGRRVPDDVAVIGFDDAPFAKHVTPSLTTVRQPIEELAARSAALLCAAMSSETVPAAGNPVLPTELVVRESA